MLNVLNPEISDKDMRVSMQLATAAIKSAVDICKAEGVGRNVGVTALCIATFNLAKKIGVPVETLVEVLRELARDEKTTTTA